MDLSNKFKTKLIKLQNERDISTNDVLKSMYIKLIENVSTCEQLYANFATIQERNINLNRMINIYEYKQLDIDIESLDEPSRKIVQLSNQWNNYFNSSNLNNSKISEFNIAITEDTIDRFNEILSYLLQDNIEEKIKKIVVKLFMSILSDKLSIISQLQTISELDNAERKEIKSADNVLNTIDFQMAAFGLVNKLLSQA